MGGFVHGLSADWQDEECPKVFAVALGDNPRQIKRTVNSFLMLIQTGGAARDTAYGQADTAGEGGGDSKRLSRFV